MALNLNNIIARRKSSKDIVATPESFMQGLPAFTINPKKEKGTNAITFNREATELLGLFQMNGDKFVDRVIVVPYTFADGSEELVMDVTFEEVIKAGKNFKAFKINQNTLTVSSNGIHADLVKHFKLDTRVASTFILEPKEGTFIMTQYFPASVHFNEGEDIPMTTNEVETQVEEVVELV